jgi:hypothetical protein
MGSLPKLVRPGTNLILKRKTKYISIFPTPQFSHLAVVGGTIVILGVETLGGTTVMLGILPEPGTGRAGNK